MARKGSGFEELGHGDRQQRGWRNEAGESEEAGNPECVSAGDGWGGQREGGRTWGRPEGMLGSHVCAEMGPRFCGCVISLLQAGSTAAEPPPQQRARPELWPPEPTLKIKSVIFMTACLRQKFPSEQLPHQ